MENISELSAVGTTRNNSITIEGQSKYYDMVVFCHLRWEFVYQRPQHIINRMAKYRNVLFVEEPIPYKDGEKNTAKLITINNNLTVLQPKVDTIQEIENVLLKHISNRTISIGWFYSASFSCLLSAFTFDKVVYDCMDELTLFKGAPPALVGQEKHLLSEASIVFTGGKSLFESKRKVHNNVHCFPSSVERKHFEKALNGIDIPLDIVNMPKPVIGYYGVIDERIDLKLINEVALLNPKASFVMIGPLAKIEESDLPRQSNIHYFGMRSYATLPNYLKGFDIAMMPFAMNDATRFISPTKTLEYMAAGRPIISTPVYDVVRDYNKCVSIVNNAEEFSAAIDTISKRRGSKYDAVIFEDILNKTSWDNTVNQMEKLLILCTV